MDRTTNAAINWVVGFVLGYLIAKAFKSEGSAVKTGIKAGTLTAIIAWIGYEKPEAIERIEAE